MRKTSKSRCSKKVPYANRALAFKAITILKKRNKIKYISDLRPYLCDNCGKWHLGHRQKDIDLVFKKIEESNKNAE